MRQKHKTPLAEKVSRPRLYKQADKNYIAVTAKILAVVERLVEKGARQQAVSFSEIFEGLPFARTTVYRILYSLERLGYVESDETNGNYRLGPKFFEITTRPIPLRQLQLLAKSVMANLLTRFGETVNLGVLDQGKVLYIDVLQSPSALRIAGHPGQRCSAHSTALGKTLLAFLPEEEINSLVEQNPLVRTTGKTITQKRHLMEHLALVRKRGIAFDLEENMDGVICVAAPIIDPNGRAVAALSVSGPAARMQAKLPSIQDEVRSAGLSLSRMLYPGFTTSQPERPPTQKTAAKASA